MNVTTSTIGGYGLGPELIAGSDAGATVVGAGGTASECGGLFALIRDFKLGNQAGGHPDFETHVAEDKGLVAMQLGPDDKPVYAKPGQTSATTPVKRTSTSGTAMSPTSIERSCSACTSSTMRVW